MQLTTPIAARRPVSALLLPPGCERARSETLAPDPRALAPTLGLRTNAGTGVAVGGRSYTRSLMTGTCAEPSCTRRVKARGLCETHYERQRTAGRPCSHPGCARPIRAKGLCKTHYDRARNADRVCAARDCTQPVKSAGLCFTHHISRITDGKGCSVAGCVRRVRSRGLCKRHYEEALAAGSVCVIGGCPRAPLGGEGMC